MNEWPVHSFGSAPLQMIDGDRGKNYPNGTDFTSDGYCLFLSARNVTKSGFLFEETTFVSADKDASLRAGKLLRGDVVLTTRGTVGNVAYFDKSVRFDNMRVNSGMLILRPDPAHLDPRYLYYFMRSDSMAQQIESLTSGSAQPQLPVRDLSNATIPVPGMHEQRAIAEVVGALDDKIAANTKLVALLDAHMAVEYTAAVNTGTREAQLSTIAEFHNRRRVPLSAREREKRPGTIPYYGASGVFGTVDEALFDEPLVLVGEDGSVMNADGTPVVQYIWGPAWVNNHAHVLKGVGVSTEVLYLAISRAQVATLVTGAVQPKINMGNLKQLVLELPASNVDRLETIVGAETASKRRAVEENKTLTATRDTLLPQLMSGKLRVKDAAKVLEDAGV